MKIISRWIFADFWHSMYGKPFVQKAKVMWVTAVRGHPEVMASAFLAVFGITLFLGKAISVNFKDKKHKYLQDIIVYRPNDPRIAEIEKTCKWD